MKIELIYLDRTLGVFIEGKLVKEIYLEYGELPYDFTEIIQKLLTK